MIPTKAQRDDWRRQMREKPAQSEVTKLYENGLSFMLVALDELEAERDAALQRAEAAEAALGRARALANDYSARQEPDDMCIASTVAMSIYDALWGGEPTE